MAPNFFSVRSMGLAALGLGLLSFGCKPGGVGDPCTPEDEYQVEFSGFSVDEVNIESRSFQCETRVCLVNHFQGRVSCPYGQSETETPINDSNIRCKVPGTSGTLPEDLISVPTSPQIVDRRPDNAVYCSCRCDGPDPNARYCECPSGYACEKLVDDLGLGSGQLAGSYCVKDGTQFNPTQARGAVCARAIKNCD